MSALDFTEFINRVAQGQQSPWFGRLSVALEGPGVLEWARLHLKGGGYKGQFGQLVVVQWQTSQSMNHYGQEAQIELMYPGPGGDDSVPNTIMAVLALTGALLELPDFHLLSNCHMNITAQRELVG